HSPAASTVNVQRLVNTGEPADWTKLAKVIASVPGHVPCFSLVDANSVRLVWGNPRKAEDISIDSGTRHPAALVPEAYASGCPDLSPDRRELLFTASTAAGGAEIRRRPHPTRTGAEHLRLRAGHMWR